MSNRVEISVIIPAYNAEATIERCLQGLVAQSLPPKEIIVVDDGSFDQTPQLSARWATVIRNNREKGPGGARNAGVAVSQGDLLAFTDSDCIPGPDWLACIARAFEDPAVAAVGSGYSAGVGDSFWQLFCAKELEYRRRNFGGEAATLVSNNLACRRTVFDEVGGFPEHFPLPSLEDMLFSYRISREHKVLWNKGNGVQHHFKESLTAFLKHQYCYALESTSFFLSFPEVFFSSNHQGRMIHMTIMLAASLVLAVLVAIGAALAQAHSVSEAFGMIALALLAAHVLTYSGFVRYLFTEKSGLVWPAYLVSLLRDALCSLGFGHGLCRFLGQRISTYRRSVE